MWSCHQLVYRGRKFWLVHNNTRTQGRLQHGAVGTIATCPQSTRKEGDMYPSQSSQKFGELSQIFIYKQTVCMHCFENILTLTMQLTDRIYVETTGSRRKEKWKSEKITEPSTGFELATPGFIRQVVEYLAYKTRGRKFECRSSQLFSRSFTLHRI